MSYRSRAAPTSSGYTKKTTTDKNQQILKSLLKDPANKVCADCKVSGHPRWTSWSLGIFICIRCSGIHRSMGTHISKVRSIDLDTWSDEQVESLVRWGNKRANLYWEAKLPQNYVPDDSKIENFIRTKYDLKRWTLSPQIPDPATLGDGQTPTEVSAAPASKPVQPAPEPVSRSSAPTTAPLNRTSSASRPSRYNNGQHHRAPPSNINKPTPTIPQHQQQQQQQPSASLIGLDFSSPIGTTPAPGSRLTPTSSGAAPAQNSRPDLKKSILSLYAATPTQAPVYNPPQQQQQQQQSFNNGLNNLTSLTGNLSLNINTTTPMNMNGFNNSSSFASPVSAKPATKASSAFDDLLSGGAQNWVNSGTKQTKPASASTDLFSQPIQPTTGVASSANGNGWGDFSTPAATPVGTTKKNGIDDDIFGNVWK